MILWPLKIVLSPAVPMWFLQQNIHFSHVILLHFIQYTPQYLQKLLLQISQYLLVDLESNLLHVKHHTSSNLTQIIFSIFSEIEIKNSL